MPVPFQYKSIESKREIFRSLRTDGHRKALVRLPTAQTTIIAERDAKFAIDASCSSGDAFGAAIAAGPLSALLDQLEI